MSGPFGIERRDPCKPVLLLGTALSKARQERASGAILLKSGEQTHQIQLAGGQILEIAGPNGSFHSDSAQTLFSLRRPFIRWETNAPLRPPPSFRRHMDPAHLLIKGVTFRKDLFNPAIFVERVPVTSLSIEWHQLVELKKMPFSSDDITFFKQLNHPTPLPMILWKRGVSPAHAASLITTLNLLGLWKEQWAPGYLPRTGTAQKILRRAQQQADDLALLGLPLDVTASQIDKAFRQLSFELHPDRCGFSEEAEARLHAKAFELISGAYHRTRQLRNSRRQRPFHPDTSLWQRALQAAESALRQGNLHLAKKHALTGLSLSPPPYAKHRFTALLKSAA